MVDPRRWPWRSPPGYLISGPFFRRGLGERAALWNGAGKGVAGFVLPAGAPTGWSGRGTCLTRQSGRFCGALPSCARPACITRQGFPSPLELSSYAPISSTSAPREATHPLARCAVSPIAPADRSCTERTRQRPVVGSAPTGALRATPGGSCGQPRARPSAAHGGSRRAFRSAPRRRCADGSSRD
jgi:hypothetical protein